MASASSSARASASSPHEFEMGRIRELSKAGAHLEALAAAETICVAEPQNRDALYLLAANQRCLNRIPEALATLERLEEHHPGYSLLYQERGHCFAALRDAGRAIFAFRQAVALNPALATSWAMLERLYRITCDERNAAVAASQLAELQSLAPEIVRAGGLFADDDLSAAEDILRTFLASGANHAEALRLLARIERKRGEFEQAAMLLERTLTRAPDYRAARLDYVRLLLDDQKYSEALEASEALLAREPDEPADISLHAAACAGLGRHEEAVGSYRRLLGASPPCAELHVSLGHSLKALGQRDEAVAAYKAAVTVRPKFGDAYWSLANLKSYRFSTDEIEHMRAEEGATSTGAVDRYHFCFALGKAHEDENEYGEAWRWYERGNALKAAECHYRPELIERDAREQIEVFTREFLAARESAGVGAQDPAPIFIIGLPRSGSTLLEQILASHSHVEATQELYEIPRIARGLQGASSHSQETSYPRALAALAPEEFRVLGERYVRSTLPYRSGKPRFVDKMPNNFRHIGLIHLILPNARIIDMRREPIGCCVSNLKQLFAAGQEFSYSAEHIARYYRSYLELMRHWDEVLPGRVLRVSYENLVDDLEGNVRRVLDFCGLEFEPRCLEFHRTQRSIGTPSSEQVRQPINRDGLEQWRHFEPWLGPLKQALGDTITGAE
jgi:tetratricopeptide (TPR) repeat protein